MDPIPCPGCGLPRAADDADRAACPVCGHLPGDPVAAADEVPVGLPAADSAPVPASVPGQGRRWVPPFVGGLAVGLAAAAAAWLLRPVAEPQAAAPAPAAGADKPVPPPAGSPGAAPRSARRPEPAPTPRPARQVASAAPPLAPPQPANAPPAAAAVPPAPKPPPVVAEARPPAAEPAVAAAPQLGQEAAPRPQRAPVVVNGVEVLTADDPAGEYRVPRVAGGRKVRVVGRADRLVLDGAAGGAAVDATGLDVRQVVVAGRVDGGAAVKVRAAGRGAVTVHGPVAGRAELVVDAGGGSVAFPAAAGGGIGDGATVRVTAGRVVLGGPVTGPGTRVDVALAAAGTLAFTSVEKAARLTYRAADSPTVYRGAVGDGAVVERR